MIDLARKHAPGNVEIYQAAATFYREQHDYKAAIEAIIPKAVAFTKDSHQWVDNPNN